MFFDIYELIEIAKGYENYREYLESAEVITRRLNLIELYYAILRDFNATRAREHYSFYKTFTIDIPDDTIFEAMEFRRGHSDLSYVDCIGYKIAEKEGVKFLTGDKDFQDLKNVEFVR